jgi:hypothetical protein
LKIFIIATAAGCAMALLLLTSLWTGPWPPAAAAPGCGCVAFRLDDIQDYFLREVQMEVINIFDRKDASLTVGVIGNYFGGDAALVQFVRDKAANNPSFEVANHGLNH